MKVLHISTFPPIKCGIASYCSNLISGLKNVENVKCHLVYDCDKEGDSNFVIRIQEPNSYSDVIELVNNMDFDLVSVQHEYGIYGGDDGELVLKLVKEIRAKIVTTLHTVRLDYNSSQLRILRQICIESDGVVVLSPRSKEHLLTKFNIPDHKVKFIFHGISDLPFEINKKRKSEQDQGLVFLTGGHLRPSKGLEMVIMTIKVLLDKGFKCRLLILGTFQSQFEVEKEYMLYIKSLIKQLDLIDNIEWVDRHLEQEEFYNWLKECDAGIVTYTEPTHNSSGFIPDILAMGRPIFCTNFEYADFIKSKTENCVFLSPFSPFSLAEKILQTYQSYSSSDLMKNAYKSSRPWTWESVASDFLSFCNDV